MSEQTTEPDEGVVLPSGDAAFGALMDVLVPDQDAGTEGAAAAEGAPAEGSAAGAAAGSTGAAAGGAEGDAPAAGAAGGGAEQGAEQPAGGAGATDGGPGGDQGASAGSAEQSAAEGGRADLPATWTAAAADVVPKFAEITTAFETNVEQAYQATALEDVRKEHSAYFDALEKHPRLLVGTEVPAIGKEGTEVLRDTADAKEWQDAVKSILVDDVRARAAKAMEDNSDFMATVHASVELFSANPDMIPGTKEFDKDLADRFTELAEPYELRVDGKLQGYSVPVQPLVNQLRAKLEAERKAAAPAAAAAPTPQQQRAAEQPRNQAGQFDAPQAGIPSKAGSGAQTEDFSALFGTLGIPDFRI